MAAIKQGRRWIVDGVAVDSYELYAVWLASPEVQIKHPGARPSSVTSDMVEEYTKDKANRVGIFRDRTRTQ